MVTICTRHCNIKTRYVLHVVFVSDVSCPIDADSFLRERERNIRWSRRGDERERKWREEDFYLEENISKASTARPSDKQVMKSKKWCG
jgi:hypothetical protein